MRLHHVFFVGNKLLRGSGDRAIRLDAYSDASTSGISGSCAQAARPGHKTIAPIPSHHPSHHPIHRITTPNQITWTNKALTRIDAQPLSSGSDLRDPTVEYGKQRDGRSRSGNRPKEKRNALNGMVDQCIEGSSLSANDFDLPFIDGEEYFFRWRRQHRLHKNGRHFAQHGSGHQETQCPHDQIRAIEPTMNHLAGGFQSRWRRPVSSPPPTVD